MHKKSLTRISTSSKQIALGLTWVKPKKQYTLIFDALHLRIISISSHGTCQPESRIQKCITLFNQKLLHTYLGARDFLGITNYFTSSGKKYD